MCRPIPAGSESAVSGLQHKESIRMFPTRAAHDGMCSFLLAEVGISLNT